MEKSINKVQLSGFLPRDPEMKKTSNGRQLARFSLGTRDGYVFNNGKSEYTVQWHSLIAWGKMARMVGSDLHKGDKVSIEGKLVQRIYSDKQGKKCYSMEVWVDELTLLVTNKKTVEGGDAE